MCYTVGSYQLSFLYLGLPHWLSCKESIGNAGDTGEFHGQRSLAGYSPWGCEESDMPQRLPLHFFSIYTPVSDYSFKSRSVCRGLLNLRLRFGSQIHTSTFISDTFTHMSNGHLTFDMSKMQFPHFKLVPSQPDHASPYSLRPLQSKTTINVFLNYCLLSSFPSPSQVSDPFETSHSSI